MLIRINVYGENGPEMHSADPEDVIIGERRADGRFDAWVGHMRVPIIIDEHDADRVRAGANEARNLREEWTIFTGAGGFA